MPEQSVATDRVYIIEFANSGWLAWCSQPSTTPQPVRLQEWAQDRSDNLIGDDPIGLMGLSYAVLSDALGDKRGFDDLFRNPEGQQVLRLFFEELILPVKNNRPRSRVELTEAKVILWARHHPPLSESTPIVAA